MMDAERANPDMVIPSAGCSPYQFGASLAAWDNELLIGSPYRYYAERQEEGIPPPATSLFQRAGTRWSLLELFAATDAMRSEGFGRSVAIGESLAIVGAPGYDNGDGPVHVFGHAGDTRVAATFDSPELHGLQSAIFDEYGAAVAADDRTLIVGAPLVSETHENAPNSDGAGVVYIFDCRKPSNRPLATLRGTCAREGFGSAVALAGDFLVVGAAGTYSNEQLSGAAYVYRRQAPGRWVEVCRIVGRHAGEAFGAAVAIDGKHFAVAAPGRPDLTEAIGGRVDLFEINDRGCLPIATFEEQPGFGGAVAIRADRVAIGQPQYTTPDGPPQTGRVGLFRFGSTGAPRCEAWLVAPQAGQHARLGSAVALGPDYIAAGAPGLGEDDDWSGFVAVKEFRNS